MKNISQQCLVAAPIGGVPLGNFLSIWSFWAGFFFVCGFG
jgi:hypothetical protein